MFQDSGLRRRAARDRRSVRRQREAETILATEKAAGMRNPDGSRMPQDTDPRKRKIRQRLRAAGLEGERLERSVSFAAGGLKKGRTVTPTGPEARDPMMRAEEQRRRKFNR
jgi:hypothetical protein